MLGMSTSENSIKAKFAEFLFHALRCIRATRRAETPKDPGRRLPRSFSLAVLLCRSLGGFHRPRHVLWGEHGVDLDGRAQCKEQRFHKGRDLRCVVHVDDDVRTPCALYVDDVGGLRLEILQYGLPDLSCQAGYSGPLKRVGAA